MYFRSVAIALVPMLLAACSMPLPEDVETSGAEEPVDERTTASVPDIDVASLSDGAAELRGRWAEDPAWCEDPDLGRVIEVAGEPEAGSTPGCRMVNLVADGSGSFTGPLACTVDGVRTSELVRVTPTEDALTLSYLGGVEPEKTLQRC